MSDPQRLLDAHHAFMDLARQWTEIGLEHLKAERVQEAKEAKRRADEWVDMAKRLEELTRKAPPV